MSISQDQVDALNYLSSDATKFANDYRKDVVQEAKKALFGFAGDDRDEALKLVYIATVAMTEAAEALEEFYNETRSEYHAENGIRYVAPDGGAA